MPRLARLDAPGVLHHLMIRGIEDRKIFRSDEDREDFLERLSTLLPETQTLCYAWTFLPNHAHFLFRSGTVPLATVMKSDERILGDSEFVEGVLSQAGEKSSRKYELKRLGFNLDRIAKRVAEIYKLKEGKILSKGKQQNKVRARSLVCFWAVRELGWSLTDLARYFGLSVPGVGYSVERGENIARENGYRLVE